MNEVINIQNLIYNIRGYRVMLDSDLARLYEVETRVLNQAVKRNIERFPAHFMFQLTKEEWKNLKSQIVIFNNDIRKYTPFVFTEQGVAMLSSVLRSKKSNTNKYSYNGCFCYNAKLCSSTNISK